MPPFLPKIPQKSGSQVGHNMPDQQLHKASRNTNPGDFASLASSHSLNPS